MDINKEAEKYKRDDITFGNSNIPVEQYCFTEYKLNKFIECICREQRNRDRAVYSINRTKTSLEIKDAILKAPLLTDKTDDRPNCDECGHPLTNDELNIGTCEDCLCPE